MMLCVSHVFHIQIYFNCHLVVFANRIYNQTYISWENDNKSSKFDEFPRIVRYRVHITLYSPINPIFNLINHEKPHMS